MFPGRALYIKIGGFPRLEVLRDKRAMINNKDRQVSWEVCQWADAKGPKKLVILSWGTDAVALDRLPDKANIAYLYHPADGKGMLARKSSKSSLFLSTPEVSSQLLAIADEVYGDFSSMSLEAMALGIKTHIFIDRIFYTSNCDLAEAFFDRSSPHFAAIPETDFCLSAEHILNFEDLSLLLAADEGEPKGMSPDQLPPGILPPDDRDNRDLTVDVIHEIATALPSLSNGSEGHDQRIFDRLRFLFRAYSEVLGRPADLKGLRHYLDFMARSNAPAPVIACAIYKILAESPEGRRRFAKGDWDWPRLTFNPVLEAPNKPTRGEPKKSLSSSS